MADGLGGNWVIGIYPQYFNDFTRIWAITWGSSSSSSHYLSYTDDNGLTWNKEDFLLNQGGQVVAYNLDFISDGDSNCDEDILYISTSKGLYSHYMNRGCMDSIADNFDSQTNCPFSSC